MQQRLTLYHVKICSTNVEIQFNFAPTNNFKFVSQQDGGLLAPIFHIMLMVFDVTFLC